MNFKSSDLVAVYFDQTKLPPTPNTSPSSEVSAPQADGKIAGVVTFFFNDNYGDKPDIGAEVLIISADKVPDFKSSAVDSFNHARTYRTLYLNYTRRGKIPDDIKDMAKKYGVDTKEGFDALDYRVNEELNKIKYSSAIYVKKFAVDGNGNYSSNIPPGKYYVVIYSNNRKGLNSTEIMGKMFFKQVTVKAGEIKSVNAKFDLY